MWQFADDVIKWEHFPCYWPFVRGIHWSPVNSPQKGQWRGALMFSLICVWINGWVNSREAGDLRRYRAHYDVTVMCWDAMKGVVTLGSCAIKASHYVTGPMRWRSHWAGPARGIEHRSLDKCAQIGSPRGFETPPIAGPWIIFLAGSACVPYWE